MSRGRMLTLAGWVLFIAGCLVVGGFLIHGLLTDDETPGYLKAAVAAIYAGLALLLVSALRRRLADRKTERYKDVQL